MDEQKIVNDPQVMIITDEEGNTIVKPIDSPEIVAVIDEDQTPEPAQEVMLSTNPQIDKPEIKVEEQPQRNEKGQFIEGNTVSIGNEGGNKCEFCERPVEILNKINLYREWCRGNVDNQKHIPYLQELISEDYLDITMSQLEDWRNSDKHKEQHTELNRAIGKLLNRQQLNLLQATLTDRVRGAMFQLSANHGIVEVSKQYQAGATGEPIEYNIHVVPKSKKQMELEDE